MLDFFFRHYEPWVDRFYILDDGSTDGSREYLAARADVELGSVYRVNPESWVASAKHIYDYDWKRSRGEADWVVVTNIDEHQHHPDMHEYLRGLLQQGVTAAPAVGYQMIADALPAADSTLWRDRPMGAPDALVSKLAIFRPDHIAETNFWPGRHQAMLEGNVVYPARDEITNLHYKYLPGLAETHARHQEQALRLGATDRVNGWGHQYAWSIEKLDIDFETYRRALVDTSTIDHHVSHSEPRWWRSGSFGRRKRSALRSCWRLIARMSGGGALPRR